MVKKNKKIKILFTGSSSFTGFNFINELSLDYELIITFSKNKSFYLRKNNNRSKRVKLLLNKHKCHFNVNFSSDSGVNFLKKQNEINVFCHHHAFTKNYKSDNFDLINAIQKNTYKIEKILEILKTKNINQYIYTGSYFEPSVNDKKGYSSFSPYGVSKFLTGEIIRHFCYKKEIKYKKFVISNPFGELEDENRLLNYVFDQWKNNKFFIIQNPEYLRDNIPILVLAKSYCKYIKLNKNIYAPSFYRMTNYEFIKKISELTRKRSNLKCKFKNVSQPKYTEPLKKINSDNVNYSEYGLNSKQIWDSFIKYYLNDF